MVTVRFSEFVDKVGSGEKRQTIRPFENYRHLKVGNFVDCYSTKKVSGVRRPVLDKLLYVGVCTEILIRPWGEIKGDEEIAKLDGFDSAEDMETWFTRRYGKIKDERLFRIIRWGRGYTGDELRRWHTREQLRECTRRRSTLY